jgi:hypothetical protein
LFSKLSPKVLEFEKTLSKLKTEGLGVLKTRVQTCIKTLGKTDQTFLRCEN